MGNSGLSAVLFNSARGRLYPIGWRSAYHLSDGLAGHPETLQPTFRLPMFAYWQSSQPDRISAIALDAVQDFWQNARSATGSHQLLEQFKLALQTYGPTAMASSETDSVRAIDLYQQAIAQSLASLKSPLAFADGLPEDLSAVLQNLAGVIVAANPMSEHYPTYLNQVLLQDQWVKQPEQIYRIPETIAALLFEFPDVRAVIAPPERPKRDIHWLGSTLIVSAGASTVDLSVVFLPEDLHQLQPTDFHHRHLAYGGNGIDQDIIAHLLHPAWNPLLASDPMVYPLLSLTGTIADWHDLGLEQLSRPSPGEPDPETRQIWQQHLNRSPFGHLLLATARYLKLILQEQERVTLEWDGQHWTLTRRQMESQILIPFVQRLNRELNLLLYQAGFSAQAINQVICAGGTASFPAIARWLRQKLPNATIVQDTYPTRQIVPQIYDNGGILTPIAPIHSRIAYGLAALPLYPQLLNQPTRLMAAGSMPI